MNTVTLMGKLSKDPELRKTADGVSVVNFCISVQSASKQKELIFLDVVAWRATAEFIEKHFRKGQMMALVGHLQPSKWTDKAGVARRSVDVVAERVYFCQEKPGSKGPVTLCVEENGSSLLS